jgi:predicted peptidase
MNCQQRNIILSICIVLLTFGCVEKEQDMQTDTNAEENAELSVVYKVPGMENVIIKKDIEYFSGQENRLTIDIYYPPGFQFESNIPAVLVVFGYSNDAAKKLVGSHLKDWSWYRSWGRLIAASGMIALIYETDLPEKDLNTLLEFLQERADEFNIDRNRLGVYSCSANVPTALVNCMDETKTYFRCAVFYYGFFLMTDQKNIADIEALSEKMGFSTPRLNAELKLRDDLPLFIVKAGLDNVPHLNSMIDQFISKAVSQNLQINFINYQKGQHGFDAYDDNDQSREVLKKTIDFWKFHLFKQ